MSYKIGVDVGGTFTDVCMFHEETGEVLVYKLPSTPWDPSEAIGEGIAKTLEENGVSPEAVAYLAHGTTVATNATLERRGCKTAIITTKGFRDVIELARQQRASLYDVQVDKPIPIVYRHLRREVDERVMFDGTVYKPLDAKEVKSLVESLKAEGVESYAVCLLHSYKNPVHEEMIERVIREIHPEAYVSISSKVLPEYREYERMTTTALNSYIGPLVGKYATNFKQRVKDMGMNVTPYINQSNGGLMSIEMTFANPIQTALSGPAAGVSGANFMAKLAGVKNFITFDMGGTSTDVSLIEDNSPKITTGKSIAEFPVKVPMADVTAVGAGGGSIAWIDNGGMFKVGPRSAGAYPGPVAYSRGGTEPTVTDANVVLHRLNPKYILGGKMQIDEQGATDAIENVIAKPLGMTVLDAARGIVRVVNANMARAVRLVSVERGYDPREFVLMAFGGAGALHAVSVAKDLGIHRVMIPSNPGILCAVGLLASDIRSDYVRTNITPLAAENASTINGIFEELEREGDAWLAGDGVPKEKRQLVKRADMRYFGQNFELSIEIPEGGLDEDGIAALKRCFHDTHKREYGYCNEKAKIQLINYRVTALGKVSTVSFREQPLSGSDPSHAVIGNREVYFEEKQGYVDTAIYDRDLIKNGNVIQGPAIIEQMDSTIVIPPDHVATADKYLNLMITLQDCEEKQ